MLCGIIIIIIEHCKLRLWFNLCINFHVHFLPKYELHSASFRLARCNGNNSIVLHKLITLELQRWTLAKSFSIITIYLYAEKSIIILVVLKELSFVSHSNSSIFQYSAVDLNRGKYVIFFSKWVNNFVPIKIKCFAYSKSSELHTLNIQIIK